MSGLGSIPLDFKIANIIVYCIGGGCLSEEANVSKLDSKVIYTCDKMLNALDVIWIMFYSTELLFLYKKCSLKYQEYSNLNSKIAYY